MGKNFAMIHSAVLNPKIQIIVPTEKRKAEILEIAPSIKKQVFVKFVEDPSLCSKCQSASVSVEGSRCSDCI